MTQSNEKSGLLGILQDLYSKIVNEITVLRMKSYRPTASSDASSHLVSQLQTYIDDEQAPPTSPSAKNLKTQQSITGKKELGKKPSGSPGKYEPPAPLTDVNGLEFSKGNSVDKLHRSVCDNLVQSVWDHLHASIRHARSGDRDAAQLHAKIMDNALREIAHYVDDEEYLEIVKRLEKELKENEI